VNLYNFEKRQKLLTKYLQTIENIKVQNREITFQKGFLIFQFHMFQTNIVISLSQCFQCPIDCNKFIEVYLEETNLPEELPSELTKEDLLLLAQIKKIQHDQFPFNFERVQNRLHNQIFLLNFAFIGFDQVGKTTLFEIVPGAPIKVDTLINTYRKEILSFPPLRINLYDFGKEVMENLASPSPAPLLLSTLRNFYLYIIVTDSTPRNTTLTKQMFLPKLKKLSPYAAFMIIANKQDLPHALSVELIENIFQERTFSLSALDPSKKDFFLNLLHEIILLRKEQMEEYHCPFLESMD